MKKLVKKIIKSVASYFPLGLIERVLLARYGYIVLAYSQHGEDAILKDLFTSTSHGFYVDVGAHHPFRFSNTFWFYRQGWSGINIDATPGSMSAFRTHRPRDINIESAIAGVPGERKFYTFKKAAFNTFSETIAKEHIAAGSIELSVSIISTTSLANILSKNISPNQQIDFLSVDVEGLELDVLQSNDWSLFVPDVIVVEDIHSDLEFPQRSPVFLFLKEKGYRLMAYTAHTFIFDRRMLNS